MKRILSTQARITLVAMMVSMLAAPVKIFPRRAGYTGAAHIDSGARRNNASTFAPPVALAQQAFAASAASATVPERSGYWVSVTQTTSVRRYPAGPEVRRNFRLHPGQYFHVDPQGGDATYAMGFACPNGGRYCNSMENLQGYVLRRSLGHRVAVNSATDTANERALASSHPAQAGDGVLGAASYVRASYDASSSGADAPSVQDVEAEAAKVPCDSSLWAHVYSRTRLRVVRPCVSLAGTVVFVHGERDGDVHIQVSLDQHLRHAPYINDRNRSAHKGELIVELLCKTTPPSGIPVEECGRWHQPIPVPHLWQRYVFTGVLVRDESPEHGWMELHPISRIESAPQRASLEAPPSGDTVTAGAHYTQASLVADTDAAAGSFSPAANSERRICARDLWLRDDRLHPIGLMHQGDRFLVERYSDGSGNRYDVWALGRAYGPGVNPQGKRGRVMVKYLCQ